MKNTGKHKTMIKEEWATPCDVVPRHSIAPHPGGKVSHVIFI